MLDQMFTYLTGAPVYVLVAVIAVAGVALYMRWKKGQDGGTDV